MADGKWQVALMSDRRPPISTAGFNSLTAANLNKI